MTERLAENVEKVYGPLVTKTKIIRLRKLPPDVFTPHAYAKKPDAFKPFSDAVLASSGLVVITPEYNGGAPGVLKYFIDMLEFPESFQKRPVCFIGLAAGAWGGLRPVEQLQQIFSYRDAFIYPNRVFIPEVNNNVDKSGVITNEKIAAKIKQQAEGFVKFVVSLKNI